MPKLVYDDNQTYFDASVVGFVPWHLLEGVRNKSIDKTSKYGAPDKEFERRQLEAVSRLFNIKYILAIMNSRFVRSWLKGRRRSTIHVYPDDWKSLPVPEITLEQQLSFARLVDEILLQVAPDVRPLPNGVRQNASEIEKRLDEAVDALYAHVPQTGEGVNRATVASSSLSPLVRPVSAPVGDEVTSATRPRRAGSVVANF